MDTRELAEENRKLGAVLCQKFMEFEEKSGMQITGIKIKRVDSAAACPIIDSVTVKVKIPDMD